MVNDEYIEQLKFVLTLCRDHSTFSHDYYVFHAGLSPTSIECISSFKSRSKMSIEVIDLGYAFRFVDESRISRTSVLRLRKPELVTEPYLHLYLDILPLPGWDDISELEFMNREVLFARKDPYISVNGNPANIAFRQSGERYF